MTGHGRPLRFLALLAAGWIGLRVVLLWPPSITLPDTIEAVIPRAAADTRTRTRTPPPLHAGVTPPSPLAEHPVRYANTLPLPPSVPPPALPMVAPSPPPPQRSEAQPEPTQSTTPSLPGSFAPLPDRWSASAWLVARPGTGIGAAPGASQLGGSQAGATIAYMLAPKARLAAFARVTTPLRGTGSETAIGMQWQPSRAPVRIVAERRFGIDGAPGGTGLGLIAGIDTHLPADFRLEAYGQAGAIHRARTEPYADGAARVTRTVAAPSDIRLALGAGVWGAAQRDAARLDIGPSATLSLPRGLRVALDWRQRVAGRARPGSGPALTLGGDF